MKKVRLIDLILIYKEKCFKKDNFFGYYFEEDDVEGKLNRLEMIYEVLGDVVMSHDYFKVFLYAGHWYGDKKYFKFTKSLIKDIYDIIIKHDDMPIHVIDSLLYHYDKEFYEKYPVKEYFDELVSKYKYEEETLKYFNQYIENIESFIKEFYSKESEKLEFIKNEYPYNFISILSDIIIQDHIEYDKIIEILPLDDFFKETSKCDSKFYAKYTDYRFIFELLKGTISLDDYDDEDYIVVFEQIVQTERGIVVEKMRTSFTKKEYLEELGKIKVKRLEKKRK